MQRVRLAASDKIDVRLATSCVTLLKAWRAVSRRAKAAGLRRRRGVLDRFGVHNWAPIIVVKPQHVELVRQREHFWPEAHLHVRRRGYRRAMAVRCVRQDVSSGVGIELMVRYLECVPLSRAVVFPGILRSLLRTPRSEHYTSRSHVAIANRERHAQCHANRKIVACLPRHSRRLPNRRRAEHTWLPPNITCQAACRVSRFGFQVTARSPSPV